MDLRYTAAGDPEQKEVILMTQEWEDALNELPFKSSKQISMVLICVV